MGKLPVIISINLLLTAVAMLSSLWDLEDGINEHFPAFSEYSIYIKFLFLASYPMLALLTIIYVIILIVERIKNFGEVRKFSKYRLQLCAEEDIEDVFNIAIETIPNLKTDSARALEIFLHNPTVRWKIVNVDVNKIEGYFLILPLTKDGRDALRTKSFIMEQAPMNFFFKNRFPKRSSVYVASIAARNKIAAGFCIKMAEQVITDKKVYEIFARAATEDGLRMAKARNMTPLHEGETYAAETILWMKP